MSEKSLITDTLREQILAVRDTGRTNMFSVNEVQRIADELEFLSWSPSLQTRKTRRLTATSYCMEIDTIKRTLRKSEIAGF